MFHNSHTFIYFGKFICYYEGFLSRSGTWNMHTIILAHNANFIKIHSCSRNHANNRVHFSKPDNYQYFFVRNYGLVIFLTTSCKYFFVKNFVFFNTIEYLSKLGEKYGTISTILDQIFCIS